MRKPAAWLVLCMALTPGCAAKQPIPLDCVTQEVVVYVDGELLAKNPDVLELRADEPHKLYFKRPGHEPQLVVLDSTTGPDGKPQLSPANVCVALKPIGLERELTIEAGDDDKP